MPVASSTAIIQASVDQTTAHLFALLQIVFPYALEIAVLFLAYHLIKKLVRGRGVGR